MKYTYKEKRDMAFEALAIWLEKENTLNQGSEIKSYEGATETFNVEVCIMNKNQGFYALSPSLSTYLKVTLEISKTETKELSRELIVEEAYSGFNRHNCY